MPALSTPAEVEKRWQRSLTAPEFTAVQAWLDQASAMVRVRLPDIDARTAADPDLKALVTGIVADAVLRVIRNPNGYSLESEGPFTVRRADALADGILHFTDSEWHSMTSWSRYSTGGAYVVSLWAE